MSERVLKHRPEISAIQYLRAIAAMSVVIFHLSWQLYWLRPTIQALTTLQSGVDLFFVISGYIMFYSTSGGSSLGPGEFFKRRLIRIVPLYWVATLAMIAVLFLAPHLVKQSVFKVDHAIASLMFFPMINPADRFSYAPLVWVGWTLNYEMLFYVFFALGIALGRRRPWQVFIVSALPIFALVSSGYIFTPEGLMKFYTDPIILEFVFGMLVAAIVTRERSPKASWIFIPLFLLFAALYCAPAGLQDYRFARFGTLSAFIILAALRAPWPRVALLRLIGDASYSIYIIHFFVLSAFSQAWRWLGLETSATEIIAFYFLGIVLTVISGVLCWQYIETPLSGIVQRALATRIPSPTGISGNAAAGRDYV
jgi:exopolysaccharide production protein ExoZ